MFLTSILALTDFSVNGDKALARAGELARGHGAALRLMYIPSGHHPDCLDPDTRLTQTASAMAQRLGLKVRTVGAGHYSLDNILVQAKQASLLVVPQRSERGFLTSWLLGPDAIRLTRHCRCPVLLARGALRRPLRQIVVGVDLTPASHQRAMLASLLNGDAQVELFHAVRPFRENQLPAVDLDRCVPRRYRDNRIEQEARSQLGRMTQSLATPAMPVVSSAPIGEPSEQLMARLALTGADLVVVGKRRRHAVVDWLLPSTAHQLLAQSPCDVLVVPEDFQLSAIRSPVQRLKEPAAPQRLAWPATGTQ